MQERRWDQRVNHVRSPTVVPALDVSHSPGGVTRIASPLLIFRALLAGALLLTSSASAAVEHEKIGEFTGSETPAKSRKNKAKKAKKTSRDRRSKS
jgi:hypothetical protein